MVSLISVSVDAVMTCVMKPRIEWHKITQINCCEVGKIRQITHFNMSDVSFDIFLHIFAIFLTPWPLGYGCMGVFMA